MINNEVAVYKINILKFTVGLVFGNLLCFLHWIGSIFYSINTTLSVNKGYLLIKMWQLCLQN